MPTTYKIYQIHSACNYAGIALISATSAERANELIKEFKKYDYENYEYSYGYEYVDEDDVMEDSFASHEGFLVQEIYYDG